MTLLKCTTKRIFFAISIFILVGSSLYAKKLTVEGQILDEDGGKVKKAELTLSKDGTVLEEERTNGNGKFKFKKLEEGEYVLNASHEDYGSSDTTFFLSGNIDLGQISLSTQPKVSPVEAVNSTMGDASQSNTNLAPPAVSVSVPQTMESMGSSSKDFIINELNFEIKKFIVFLDLNISLKPINRPVIKSIINTIFKNLVNFI